MIIKDRKAFSLTELLIVLAIVAILFAALTPIVTRQAKSELNTSESVWNFVTGDSNMSSYFDPGVVGWQSSAFIGANNSLSDDRGKLVVNTTGAVPQFQFRYSPDVIHLDKGVQTSSLFLTDKGDLFFGSDLSASQYKSDLGDIAGNTVFGVRALAGVNSRFTNSTVLGNNAMANASQGGNVIAIGNGAGMGNAGLNSIYIGEAAGSGAFDPDNAAIHPQDNIAIGYHSMGDSSTGSRNVFIGGHTGNSFSGNNNVVIASRTEGGGIHNSVIIGSEVDLSGRPNGMIAIGKHACAAIKSDATGDIICIGNEAAARDPSNGNLPAGIDNDGQHIYIGGTPHGGFGGRSVLEIHHPNDNGSDGDTGKPTVILNSNLVLRGRLYVSDGKHLIPATYHQTEEQWSHSLSGNTRWADSTGGYSCNKDAEIDGKYYCTDLKPRNRRVYYAGAYDTGNCGSDGFCTNHFYEYNRLDHNYGFYVPTKIYVEPITDKNYSYGELSPLPKRTHCDINTYQNNAVNTFCPDYNLAGLKNLTGGKNLASNDGSGEFIEYNGRLRNCQNGLTCEWTSDIRLKTDIVKNNDGLDQILSLVPYNYKFKSDLLGIHQVGVIAQDLQKVFPTSVKANKDGFLSIRWDEMFFSMINAIKSLSAKVESIASDILNLEKDVKLLKSSNKSANKKVADLNRRLTKLEKQSRSNK